MDDVLDVTSTLTASIENLGSEVVRKAVRDQIDDAVQVFEDSTVERLVMLELMIPQLIESMGKA